MIRLTFAALLLVGTVLAALFLPLTQPCRGLDPGETAAWAACGRHSDTPSEGGRHDV